jgi:hypothetical protein
LDTRPTTPSLSLSRICQSSPNRRCTGPRTRETLSRMRT